MKSPIPYKVSPDIAARFGSVPAYHKAKGKKKSKSKKK